MSKPAPSRLVPLAGLLFVAGSVLGWLTVMGIKGCVSAGPSAAEETPASGGEVAEGQPAAPGPAAEHEDDGSGAAGGAGRDPSEPDPATAARAAAVEGGSVPEPARAEPPVPAGVPEGRDIPAMAPRACYTLLQRLDVSFERRGEAIDEARGDVAAPLLLRGPVAGVTFEHVGRSETHEVVDCRLVVALVRWASLLRSHGVRRVEHMSMYRPDSRVRSTGERSGHSVALAIDAALFELDDGSELNVLEDWSDKERDAEPCAEREGEPDGQALLRELVCRAAERDLFQVVITPHHNRAHRNHVHLELVPEVDWSFVR